MFYSNTFSIRRINLLGLFLLTVICSIPTTQIKADPTIWKDVTVFSATGLEYRNIDIEIGASGKEIVIIKEDNSQNKMRISNIKLILDSNGKDITAQILDIAENNKKLNSDEEMWLESDEYSDGYNEKKDLNSVYPGVLAIVGQLLTGSKVLLPEPHSQSI